MISVAVADSICACAVDTSVLLLDTFGCSASGRADLDMTNCHFLDLQVFG